MKNFLSVNDVHDVEQLTKDAIALKSDPYTHKYLGENKTLVLLFMNASLRTRISTQKAAQNLGMHVIVLNVGQDSWNMEFEDGAVMNGTSVEHVKEGAAVISKYADIIGLRSFPTLTDKVKDYSEFVLHKFLENIEVPLLNMESATVHPLQSLADLITIRENTTKPKPKVILSWAPHIKPLPQCVANSFAEWMNKADVELIITHPKGYELDNNFTQNANIEYKQERAFENADFIYAKNWSAYSDYGKIIGNHNDWMIDLRKMKLTNQAKFMHCLPTRRNIEVADDVLDSNSSIVLKQAENRIWSAQIVLKKMLESV